MAHPESIPVATAPGVPPDSATAPAPLSKVSMENDPRVTADRYHAIRGVSKALAGPLDPEDCVAQSMPDASPVKWHLAHTTWFFETFALTPHAKGYAPFHPAFGYLFNSYYNGAGDRHARFQRGVLTRPSLSEVLAYRAHVDERLIELLARSDGDAGSEVRRIVEMGLHHEQQHQELILTDVKHLFAQNALLPAYRAPLDPTPGTAQPMGFVDVPEGVCGLGHGGDGFSFDNERPRHRVFIEGSQIANRLVTNGEFRDFIEDGGYRRPELWLDRGWATVQREGWHRPFYWLGEPGADREFTLAGERALCDAEPVSHVSFFEADAYARWAGARLPTEAEWETVGSVYGVEGNFVDDARLHPDKARNATPGHAVQLFGDLWEWTRSSYAPYPGYQPEAGTLGEYNGKFMCDQIVLRGGSCASSRCHLRSTYRNFFYAPDRWQFTGIRLAKDLT